MEQANKQTTPAECVTARVRYLESDEDLTDVVPSVGGEDAPEHHARYVDRTVNIHNGRLRSKAFDLDREGFSLQPQGTAVTDFYDDAQIAHIYEEEVKSLLLRVTGGARVEVFDHTRRSASREVRSTRQIREPATTIHSDYTAFSGIQRLLDHFHDRADEVVRLMRNRFAIVNVWRSIAGTVETAPLTVCDATTLAERDLVAVKRRGRDRLGEIQLALPNDLHTWYYFPGMNEDEALLIKTYDSDTELPARFTIHTSFDDPGCPRNAPARESIETRSFVFFE